MTEEVRPRWPAGAPAAAGNRARYEDLAQRAAEARVHFSRGFTTRLHDLGDGSRMSITELDDDFHSMRVALHVAADGEILDAGSAMLRHPFDTCPRALDSVRSLVGVNVERPGAHRQIKDSVPRQEGCLHLVDMLTIAFRSFRIAHGHDMPGGQYGTTERSWMLAHMPNVRDTCVSFAIETPGT